MLDGEENVMPAVQNNNSVESMQSHTLIPFIIGVTGHRDPVHLQGESTTKVEIKQAIKDCILFWRDKLGDKTPIWLMSAMAEGSDLLAIQAIEELQTSGLTGATDFKIIPCLPMASKAYEKDFTAAPNEQEFGLAGFKHYLNAYQKNIIVVDEQPPINKNQQPTDESDIQLQRNYQYLNVGLFIAKYSNVLLALWDGHSSKGIGGTADIVRYKCGEHLDWCSKMIPTGLRPHSEFDGQIGGVVQHIPIVRRQSASEQAKLVELIELKHKAYTDSPYPLYVSHSSNKESNPIQTFLSNEFALLNQQIVRFNSHAELNHIDKSPAKIAGIEKGLQDTAHLFYQADASAIAYQKKYRNNLGSFIRLAAYGLICYEIMSIVLNSSFGIAFNIAILLCIFALILLIKLDKKNQTKIKYQTFRCVAEALRIRAYLNIGNVPPDVKPIIPRRYRQNWPIINYASRLAELVLWSKTVKTDMPLLKAEWLQGQIEYLDSRLQMNDKSTLKDFFYKRPKKAATLLARWSRRSFILAIFIAIALMFIQTTHVFQPLCSSLSMPWLCNPIAQWLADYNTESSLAQYTLLSVQFALMLGTVMALWQELANYQYTYNGYENLRMLFVRALYLLDKKPEKLPAEMLTELAREAMEEHTVWNHSEHQTDLIHR